VDAHNAAVGSLERMVLPQARRFRDLGATSAAELPAAEPVARVLRAVVAEELAADDGAGVPGPPGGVTLGGGPLNGGPAGAALTPGSPATNRST
jgi:hypothetical protein